MKKLKLYALKTSEKRIIAVVEKCNYLKTIFHKLTSFDFQLSGENFIDYSSSDINIMKIVDTVEYYKSDSIDLDIVYGYNRVFLIGRSNDYKLVELFKKTLLTYFNF